MEEGTVRIVERAERDADVHRRLDPEEGDGGRRLERGERAPVEAQVPCGPADVPSQLSAHAAEVGVETAEDLLEDLVGLAFTKTERADRDRVDVRGVALDE